MKVDSIISLKCWCGEVRTRPVRSGNWYSANNAPRAYTLMRCVSCGTIRTGSVAGDVAIEYDDTALYGELAVRHHNSLKTVAPVLAEKRVLEIGCNQGAVMEWLIDNAGVREISGIDFNAKAVERALSRGLDVSMNGVESINRHYDAIIGMHVLEHVMDLRGFLQSVRALVPVGTIYFSVPNIASFNARRKLDAWGALNPHEHIWHFSLSTIRSMITTLMPDARILVAKTSWVWPLPGPFAILNRLLPGDQLEILLEVGQ